MAFPLESSDNNLTPHLHSVPTEIEQPVPIRAETKKPKSVPGTRDWFDDQYDEILAKCQKLEEAGQSDKVAIILKQARASLTQRMHDYPRVRVEYDRAWGRMAGTGTSISRFTYLELRSQNRLDEVIPAHPY